MYCVCVENTSQMAEFFRKFTSESFNVSSAGMIPSSHLYPLVALVINKIKISGQKPKLISDSMIKKSCPLLFANDVLALNISCPKNKFLDKVQDICYQIKNNVLNLIDSLKAEL